ncbi:MAG: sugar phosphate isomerase/epimerase family protein [Anaerolineae bacterium]
MNITGIGINSHPDRVRGDFNQLLLELEDFQALGYDCVELPAEAVLTILNGHLHPLAMKKVTALLNMFDLCYTVHAPRPLDVRDVDRLDMQKDLFKACIQFTAEIGANIFVYHYDRKTDDPYIEETFEEIMRAMADFAAEYNVLIGVENIEIDAVANVVAFLETLNHDHVAMTFDFGHAYLSAARFGSDFLDSVQMAAPWIRHIHVTDNFGRFDETRLVSYELYEQKRYADRLLLGEGDLHLPIGWGNIAFDDAFALLQDYTGLFMLEYHYQRYKFLNQQIITEARKYIDRARGESPREIRKGGDAIGR